MYPFLDLPFARIGTFPLCVGAGLMVLVLDILVRGRREGLTRAQMDDVFVPALPLCLLFGVVVAAATDTLFHDGVLAACRHPFGRGVNYFGWMLGCLISLFALGRMFGLDVRTLFEIFVPPSLSAQAVGRLGCFLGGCCYGVPVDSAWGVVYPCGSLPFAAYGLTPLAPVPLYEAGWLLAAFAVVRLRVPRGRRAAVSLMAMGTGRFALEFLRGDSRGVFFPGVPLSPAQCLSIVLLLLGASLLLRVFERPARVLSSGGGEKDGRGPAASGT